MVTTQSMMISSTPVSFHSMYAPSVGLTLLEVLLVLILLGILGALGMTQLIGNMPKTPVIRDILVACQLSARGRALSEGGGICLRFDPQLTLYRTPQKTVSGEREDLFCPGIAPGFVLPQGMTISSVPDELCSDAFGRLCPEALLQPDEKDPGIFLCPVSSDPADISASVTIQETGHALTFSINKETGWIE